MSNETMKTQANDLLERGKGLVEEGNQRQIAFLSKSGATIFETKLTLAVAVVAVLLITGIMSFPIVLIVSAIAYMMGIRADIRMTSF